MKKINNQKLFTLIIGILLLLASYKFDQNVNLFFKQSRLGFLDFIFSIITNFSLVLAVILLLPLMLLYKRNKKLSYLLLITFFASVVLTFIAKLIISRQRPMQTLTYPVLNIINYSFPSMHAAVAFSLLPALVKFLPKQKYFWVVFAFLVAFSRVYFGLHFLSDVVFGTLFGYFIGIFALEYYEKNANK